MSIERRPNETVIRQGLANLKKGWEAVGGALFLTNQRLYFSAHSININGGVTQIALRDVCSAQPGWTRLFGIPLVPNALTVQSISSEEYRFVVFGRSEWAKAIDRQRTVREGAQ